MHRGLAVFSEERESCCPRGPSGTLPHIIAPSASHRVWEHAGRDGCEGGHPASSCCSASSLESKLMRAAGGRDMADSEHWKEKSPEVGGQRLPACTFATLMMELPWSSPWRKKHYAMTTACSWILTWVTSTVQANRLTQTRGKWALPPSWTHSQACLLSQLDGPWMGSGGDVTKYDGHTWLVVEEGLGVSEMTLAYLQSSKRKRFTATQAPLISHLPTLNCMQCMF